MSIDDRTVRAPEVLLVEEDPELAETILAQLTTGEGCRVTVAHCAADALREELTTRHELLLTSMDLPDADGFELISKIRRHNRCPVILMGWEFTVEQAVDAMRAGVVDLLVKPLDPAELSERVLRAAVVELIRRRDRSRYRRLRRVARKVVRERGDLNERIDLVCRDIVHAYRRLAQKVVGSGILPTDQSRSI